MANNTSVTPQTSPLKGWLSTLALLAVVFAVPGFAQKKKFQEVVPTQCWSYPVEGGLAVAASPVGAYVAREGGVVEAVSPLGSRIWSTDLGGTVVSNVEPKFISVLVITSAADGTGAQLRSLSAETGVVRWSAPVHPAPKYSIQYFEITVTVTAEDGAVEFFDAATGKPAIASIKPESETIVGDDLGNVVRSVEGRQIWKYRTGGAISKVIEFEDAIVAGSNDNFVYSIARPSGRVRWKYRLPGRVGHLSSLGTEVVIVSTLDESGLALLETSRGRPAGRVTLGGDESVVGLTTVDERSFLVLSDANLYRYSTDLCTK